MRKMIFKLKNFFFNLFKFINLFSFNLLETFIDENQILFSI